MKFLHRVPSQLVPVGGVHGEGGVLVPRVGGADRGRGGGHVRPGAGGVDVAGHQCRERHRCAEHHRGGLVVVRVPADLAVRDVRRQDHAALRRPRVVGQQPQRLPGGFEHRDVLEFLVVADRVGLAQRRGDRERADRRRPGLTFREKVGQRWQRRGQVNPHGASS